MPPEKQVVEYADGQRDEWQDEALGTHKPLRYAFEQAASVGYRVQLLLDGELAYAGRYQPEMIIL